MRFSSFAGRRTQKRLALPWPTIRTRRLEVEWHYTPHRARGRAHDPEITQLPAQRRSSAINERWIQAKSSREDRPIPVTGTASTLQLTGLHGLGAIAREREPL